MSDTRVEELEALAAAEGINLPMDAAEIIALEDEGFVVDLETGQILEDIDPDEPITVSPYIDDDHGNILWN